MSRAPLQPETDAILDSVADGVFTVDDEWRITSFNRAAEQITGVSREEAVGQHCCEVFKSSICESECALRHTKETGQVIVAKQTTILNANGHKIPISVSTGVLKDQDGRVIGGVESFRDLSVVEELRKELQEKYTFADIVGRSRAIGQLLDVLPQISESASTVLIEGASGTGKELFARAIHNLSPRKDKRFVAINCGALPDNLLESELFGYVAGAFTDARKDKPGRFKIADGGTMLLDEIGDISPAMQAKLLRVLQERTFEPLGSVDPVHVDVRVVAATNQNLKQLVQDGTFRQDLYYRINVVRLQLPALQDRREDIPLLVDHFISKFNRLQDRHIVGVSDEVKAVLFKHDFPGNIRELENVVEHAFVLCRGPLIQLQHLPHELYGTFDSDAHAGGGLTLKALEEMYISEALGRHHGNRAAAARELGINPSTLFRKIKSLDIEVPTADGRSHESSPPESSKQER